MQQVLAIDLGTSGCRSALFNQNLEILASAKVDYSLLVHSEAEIDQNPRDWWDGAKQTIQNLGKIMDLQNVRAISISSQGISLTPVSGSGEFLSNAISWLDTRAVQEEKTVRDLYGKQELYQRTGVISSPLYSLPKLVWMKKNRSPVFERAEKILLPMDVLLLRLTGNMVTDHTMATGTMCYNIRSRQWDEALLCEQGLSASKLPEIFDAGSVAGTILPEVARELGLPADVVVAVGGQDQKCAAYGAGATEKITTASIGTCTCITKLTSTLDLDRRMQIPCFSYLKEGLWDLEGIINTTGSALQWFRDKFAPGYTFRQLDDLAATASAPGTVKFYPNLAGAGSPYWEKGMGMFAELTLDSDVGQCTRAILEGVAYNIRANLDRMDEMGKPTEELRLFGGGANSPLWCQIIADVIGRPVTQMRSSDTALAGAARLAFESIGIQTGTVKKGNSFFPAASRDLYEEAYASYESFRKRAFLV